MANRRKRASAEQCKHEITAAWCSLCNPGLGVEPSARKWESEHPDAEIVDLIKGFLGRLSDESVAELCAQLLEDTFVGIRRRRVRDIEERAAREHKRAQRDAQVQRANKYAETELVDHPWEADARTRIGQAWRRLPQDERAKRRAAADDSYGRFLREVQDGRYGNDDYAAWTMKTAIAEFEQATRQAILLELTTELLESKFALGDGTLVSWGDATADQHKRRFELLLTQASGNVRAAQRHQAAVTLLCEHRVSSLNEVAAVAA